MSDSFIMAANGHFFGHNEVSDQWFLEADRNPHVGTRITMEISNQAKRTPREVFDRYTNLESGNYEFSKTHVPLKLAKSGPNSLISRSQAKRVLARFESDNEVCLDFAGIDSIGPAFADEVFRVYPNQNPGVAILPFGENEKVRTMINRARGGWATKV